jgi:2-polyprenyl-3-methyl-5-hydroxy-6-metoxy-1,4-benzoquinol methylase
MVEVMEPFFAGAVGKKALELGCARSQFLPHFATGFGCQVTGLDYAEAGCKSAAAMLKQAGVTGEIVQADMFDPPAALKNSFDFVFSYGLIEHFTDTAAAIRASTAFLKQDGLAITIVPNMVGFIGFLQKLLDRNVYNIHMLLDREKLRASHEAAGLEIIRCEYLLFINNNAVATASIKNHFLHKIVRRILSISSKIFWIAEERLKFRFPANRVTSPYIVCIARKKAL